MSEVMIILIAYLLGSIPFGLIVGKIGYNIDIRDHGSGNLGGTNTFRVLGKKAGIIVTLGDILKGTLAALLPLLIEVDIHPLIIGLFASVGHMFPIFAKFKGGKAVATSGGVLLGYQPLTFLFAVIVFFLLLIMTRYVSLSSMLAGILTVFYSLYTKDVPLIIVVSVLSIFIIYRHRANIQRLINKTEPKAKLW
ncbi:glycerol-3-phosphate 1-O-acyltransferase PlsY [Cytobacillus sp. IB215665]|uniref:glycerol-3-phosphate 1-O-acyltransferase PlsY n=1 Tax=Cytobacillus sp. IB215665 TaxID=3097357 RepID=UPI002A0C3867|nr:glycerol-3-phosphate 1-O-acyltransferase PlsY [Cytobacillus sp. IB215665]MDX8366951.1 glycerol-3-phosphate 1-O-acyltransferase PlsY [Cytobacillus sp. IB215665]